MIYGDDIAKLLSLFAVIGLIASFHTIIFAFGRQIYSLSRAGYYPAVMSITHGERKTPHIALFTGAAIGLAVIMAVWFSLGAEKGGAIIGATLLNMAVFGAMISYAFQGISFILLRKNMPNIERPYRSPLGIPGAALTVVIALRHALLPAAGSGVSRRRLRRARLVCRRHPLLRARSAVTSSCCRPKRSSRSRGGQHGHPESEGYGTTKI